MSTKRELNERKYSNYCRMKEIRNKMWEHQRAFHYLVVKFIYMFFCINKSFNCFNPPPSQKKLLHCSKYSENREKVNQMLFADLYTPHILSYFIQQIGGMLLQE
jgi:hypothetical protein